MIRFIGFVLSVFADRLRGNQGILPKQIKRLFEALAWAMCLGLAPDARGVSVWLSIWAGICLAGYGNAIGPALTDRKPARTIKRAKYGVVVNPGPEWWQRGVLLDSAWASLVAVGVIWGMPGTIAGIVTHQWQAIALIPALSFSFPFSCYVAKRFFSGSWISQQWLFGLSVGLLLFLS